MLLAFLGLVKFTKFMMQKLISLGLLGLHVATVSGAEVNQPVPQCPAHFADSQRPLDINSYRGKVVLVDFWATWCAPCQKSMPFLNRLRNDRQGEGFEVVAINVDENIDDARQYLESHPVDYPVVFDPEGRCPGVFGVQGMPSSFFIDKKGMIRKVHVGFREENQAEIRDFISKLLSEQI